MARAQAASVRIRKRDKKNIVSGVAHIRSSFNNTIVTLADLKGNVIAWATAGSAGFKGTRKSTPYAAQMAAEMAAQKAAEHGLKNVHAYIQGAGGGREAAVTALNNSGIAVTAITDCTAIPHNGPRAPKRRRV